MTRKIFNVSVLLLLLPQRINLFAIAALLGYTKRSKVSIPSWDRRPNCSNVCAKQWWTGKRCTKTILCLTTWTSRATNLNARPSRLPMKRFDPIWCRVNKMKRKAPVSQSKLWTGWAKVSIDWSVWQFIVYNIISFIAENENEENSAEEIAVKEKQPNIQTGSIGDSSGSSARSLQSSVICLCITVTLVCVNHFIRHWNGVYTSCPECNWVVRLNGVFHFARVMSRSVLSLFFPFFLVFYTLILSNKADLERLNKWNFHWFNQVTESFDEMFV